MESQAAGQTSLQKAIRGAVATLRQIGVWLKVAGERVKRGLEALRAAGKVDPTGDDILQAALDATG